VAPSSRFTKSSKKATKLEALRVAVDAQSNRVIEENPMRTDFGDKFKAFVDDYNAGSRNIEQLFEQLLKLSQSLFDERQRFVREDVTQD
jgi:type I restriction enzyme R subunit